MGKTKTLLAELGKLSNREALKYTINLIKQETALRLREVPAIIKQLNIECLLVDQVSADGGTIAEYTNIPFISVCSAVVLNRDLNIPPCVTNWQYASKGLGRVWKRQRNKLGYKIVDRLVKPVTETIDSYRQQWNLPPASNNYNDRFSKLAQISQQPIELEFPRKSLPSHFHFTGPFHTSLGRDLPTFPYEKLTGKPIIYASLSVLFRIN